MGSAASCLQRIAAAGGERQRFFTSAELAANGRDPFAHGSKTAGGVMTGSSSMTPPSSPRRLKPDDLCDNQPRTLIQIFEGERR